MTSDPPLILIVEDNPFNMELVRDLLVACGWRVAEAEDAEACRDALRRERPWLILMDLQLPVTDGFTLIREIRETPERRSIPIVALTAYAMREEREKALAAGCLEVIVKPIDVKSFQASIQRIMERHPGEAAT